MYDFYGESRNLERIFKASNLEPSCRDPDLETPRLFELVQEFSEAIDALASDEGADGTPERLGRYSTAAGAILRTDLAFHAVKSFQHCSSASYYQPRAALDHNMEGVLTEVAPITYFIGAIFVLRALMSVALQVEHTRFPLLEQVRFLKLPLSHQACHHHVWMKLRSISRGDVEIHPSVEVVRAAHNLYTKGRLHRWLQLIEGHGVIRVYVVLCIC